MTDFSASKIDNKTTIRKRALILAGRVHDVLAASVCLYFAFGAAVGFDGVLSVPRISEQMVLFAGLAAVVFHFVGLNRGSWRYASVPDLLAILRGSALTVVIFTGVLFVLSRADNLPRSVPPLTFLFTVVALSGSRLIYRLFKEAGFLSSKRRNSRAFRNVLLLGANANAESFIRAVRRSEKSGIRVVGLLDDHYERNVKFQGLKVLGGTGDISNVTSRLSSRGELISEIVLTDASLDRARISEIVSDCTAAGLPLSRIPDLSDTSKMAAESFLPRKIELQDLLGRSEVVVDNAKVAHLIQGKTVFITGSGGSIGSELSRQIASFHPRHLILTDNSEHFLYQIDKECRELQPNLRITSAIADIRDEHRIEQLVSQFKPEVIFHAAALKHVPLMENNILECIKTNVIGTRNLADCAVRHDVKTFVMISTDKAINPTNVMGATKRAAEVYCQALDLEGSKTRFKTVRFGNVLGSNGSVVPLFETQIARGGPVTVTHPEITRFFMTIPEAVRLVLQASVHGMARTGDRGKILILDMGEPVRISELARKMIELAGYRPDIDIKIEYTGLRPGEKLYEELLDINENADANDGRGYILAFPRTVNWSVASGAIRAMKKAVQDQDSKKAIVELSRLVPEYKTQIGVPVTKSASIITLKPAAENRQPDG